ncbi:hypothetical protein LX36DRAFT_439465 [Colletotrichum falcatum]|nr:hypothetical protein LX36DRAFT_439465 [Colletotrichum falcatum]
MSGYSSGIRAEINMMGRIRGPRRAREPRLHARVRQTGLQGALGGGRQHRMSAWKGGTHGVDEKQRFVVWSFAVVVVVVVFESTDGELEKMLRGVPGGQLRMQTTHLTVCVASLGAKCSPQHAWRLNPSRRLTFCDQGMAAGYRCGSFFGGGGGGGGGDGDARQRGRIRAAGEQMHQRRLPSRVRRLVLAPRKGRESRARLRTPNHAQWANCSHEMTTAT